MFIFQNLKKFFWLYCTRKSVPPPLFTLSLPIQNKKPSKKAYKTRRAGEKKSVSGGGTKTVQLPLPGGG